MEKGNTAIAVERESDSKYHCAYCGAALNFSFYFCLSCATPYKSLDSVMSPYIVRRPGESELIRQKAPNVWRVFWTYAIVLFVAMLLYFFIGDDSSGQAYTMLTCSALMVMTTVVVGIIYWPSLAVQLKRFGFLNKHAWLGLAALPLMLLLNFSLLNLVTHFEPAIPSLNDELVKMGFGHLSSFIIICLIPGITEEIAYRGLIQHWLQTAIKPWRALILTSALFTAMHLSVLSAPYLFLLGLLLGWLKLKTGSLYPSMLVHILHNYAVISIFPLLRV